MSGLTQTQKMFVSICKRLELPLEQMTFCLTLFGEEEQIQIMIWMAEEMMKTKRDMTRKEFMEEIHRRALEHLQEERTANSPEA